MKSIQNTLFLCLFFCASVSLSQNSLSMKVDISGDKLITENNKILFFAVSPLSDLGDHNGLFLNIQGVNPLIGRRAYECSWEIKEKQLYLTKFEYITPDEEYIDEKGNIKKYKMSHASHEIFVQEMEKYTKRKFDKNQQIKADWLNGKYRLFTVQQDFFYGKTKEERKVHLDSLSNHQKYFLAHFKEGKLINIEKADKNWKTIKNNQKSNQYNQSKKSYEKSFQ